MSDMEVPSANIKEVFDAGSVVFDIVLLPVDGPRRATAKVIATPHTGESNKLDEKVPTDEMGQMLAAFRDALATEYAETSVSAGWRVSVPAANTPKESYYGIHQYSPGGAAEAELFDQLAGILPYEVDRSGTYAFYEVHNKFTGNTMLSFVHTVDREDKEDIGILKEVEVYTEFIAKEDLSDEATELDKSDENDEGVA